MMSKVKNILISMRSQRFFNHFKNYFKRITFLLSDRISKFVIYQFTSFIYLFIFTLLFLLSLYPLLGFFFLIYTSYDTHIILQPISTAYFSLFITIKSTSKVYIPCYYNQLTIRYMLNNIKKSSTNKIKTLQRLYANMAGKTELSPAIQKEFDKNTLKSVINPHAQLVTDFGLIYKDISQIKLYIIGTLYTNSTSKSYELSKNKNYKLEEKPQNIEFFKKPIIINKDLHIIKPSMVYFKDPIIKQKIEESYMYKQQMDTVLSELKKLNIEVRVANTPEDEFNTGYHILNRLQDLKKKNNYMDTLPINQNNEVD